jgi:hypothetical protein
MWRPLRKLAPPVQNFRRRARPLQASLTGRQPGHDPGRQLRHWGRCCALLAAAATMPPSRPRRCWSRLAGFGAPRCAARHIAALCVHNVAGFASRNARHVRRGGGESGGEAPRARTTLPPPRAAWLGRPARRNRRTHNFHSSKTSSVHNTVSTYVPVGTMTSPRKLFIVSAVASIVWFQS